MYQYSIVLTLAIFSGIAAALPDVGSCTFMEYFCDARKCSTSFIKALQNDPKGDCNAKFSKMARCVAKSVQICVGDALSKSQIDSIVQQSFKENTMCYEGGRDIPTMPSVGSPCSSSFSSNANDCVRTFHQKFAANKSDPDLCSENAKAKKCLKNLVASDCTFPSAAQEILDLGFSDYNPYCASNRDPGATGNDMCYRVKPLDNPFHNNGPAAVRIKIGVWQALAIPLLLLLFLVQI